MGLSSPTKIPVLRNALQGPRTQVSRYHLIATFRSEPKAAFEDMMEEFS